MSMINKHQRPSNHIYPFTSPLSTDKIVHIIIDFEILPYSPLEEGGDKSHASEGSSDDCDANQEN